jgi:hypothetical protein
MNLGASNLVEPPTRFAKQGVLWGVNCADLEISWNSLPR